MIPIYNDIDVIYGNGIKENDGYYVCTVCDKKYKRLSTTTKHMEKQNCHSYRNLFDGSDVETLLFKLYKIICGITDDRRHSFIKFRKSSYYSRLAKYYIFCYNNGISEYEYYLQFLITRTKWKSIYGAVDNGLREHNLKKYMVYKRYNISEEENERFYEQYEDFLQEDVCFVLRSIERGDISIKYIFNNNRIDFDRFLDNLSDIEKIRLETILLEHK